MTTLMDIARKIPLGFECRSCGGSAYNWVSKIARFQETGEPCCAYFNDWVTRADAEKAPS